MIDLNKEKKLIIYEYYLEINIQNVPMYKISTLELFWPILSPFFSYKNVNVWVKRN